MAKEAPERHHPEILNGALETHPITIRRNVVRENPHYVALQEFLDRLELSK